MVNQDLTFYVPESKVPLKIKEQFMDTTKITVFDVLTYQVAEIEEDPIHQLRIEPLEVIIEQ